MYDIHTGQMRQSLQKKYHLKNSPCNACCLHCCLHWCALCQEHREMKGRLSDNMFSEMTVVNPPPIQEMKSTDEKETAETSSPNNNGHTDLEIQAV
ncbi:cell number regulator 6 [Vigna angularis]|uniref:cell number regulator 6 n=1 Tax=Phaseolus angularis TaxID=3914 RepID=UPI000809CF23|nr:cell number regulator 6 [Vigna angularis]